MEVIASDKRDVFRDAQARLEYHLDRGQGNRIVIAEYTVRSLSLQQAAHRIIALLPVFSVRCDVGAYQAGIESYSMPLECQFVTFKPANSGREFQAANMSDPFASHFNQMFRGDAPDCDVIDSDEVGLEAGEVAIDENKWNSLLCQLLEFRGRGTTGRDDQSIETMRKELLNRCLFNGGIFQ